MRAPAHRARHGGLQVAGEKPVQGVAGLQPPSSGRVLIDGEDATGLIGRVGYMLQKDLLLPWRNVVDNAILAQEIEGRPRREARAKGGFFVEPEAKLLFVVRLCVELPCVVRENHVQGERRDDHRGGYHGAPHALRVRYHQRLHPYKSKPEYQ